jgi:hypothetical protein
MFNQMGRGNLLAELHASKTEIQELTEELVSRNYDNEQLRISLRNMLSLTDNGYLIRNKLSSGTDAVILNARQLLRRGGNANAT